MKHRSKLLSYVLRHRPDELGIELDAHGWTEVDTLLDALIARDSSWSEPLLREVVETNTKQRFEFDASGRRIRARQGHSVEVDLGYEPTEPPEFLFHGTVPKYLDAIRAEGLRPMSRHHVHLSPDVETAKNVGSRRGKPVILRIRAAGMAAMGHRFMRTGNDVWLVEEVPPEFIVVDDGAGPSNLGARDFAHYDCRKYPSHDVVTGYAKWAPVYDERMDDRLDVDLFARSPLIHHVAGAEIVDLACGTGRIGQWLADRGVARLVGVDLSAEMLAHAKARGIYAELIEADVTSTPLADHSFDAVVSSMALCHVPSLAPFFAEVARLLRPDGWIFFVDFHPFFLMNGVPTHFDDPQTGESQAVQDHVHPFSEYFDAAKRWFELVEVDERFVDDAWVEDKPGFAKFLGWPVTIAMGFRLRTRTT